MSRIKNRNGAEQADQPATRLSPGNAEAVFRYVRRLGQQNCIAAARRILQTAITAAPDNQQFPMGLNQLK